jgi:hypothetical protein
LFGNENGSASWPIRFLLSRAYAAGAFAFGRAVPYILLCFVFALYERKNKALKDREYLAAAG